MTKYSPAKEKSMSGRKKTVLILNKQAKCNARKDYRPFLNKKLKLVLVMLKSNYGL